MTHTSEVVQSISEVINLCDRYGLFGIADELFSIIREISPEWESEKEGERVNINSEYYTAIIIEVGIFESEIADEKHFRTEDEAREFCQTVQEGQIAVIAKVS